MSDVESIEARAATEPMSRTIRTRLLQKMIWNISESILREGIGCRRRTRIGMKKNEGRGTEWKTERRSER